MPITPAPRSYLSDRLVAIQRQLDEVTRAVGRPSNQVQDANGNVVHMPGAEVPAIVGRDQDAGISFNGGLVTVTDGQGRSTKPLTAQQFNGPVVGDTTGIHHGDVGTPTESHNHYGDLHGNAYGFHYGPVGDGTTQNQINCLNIFHTGAFGRCFGEVGQAGGPFFTTYGDVGNATNFFNLFGTVHAPSEGHMKVAAAPLSKIDAGSIVDDTPISTWKWDKSKYPSADDYAHAGPMAEDVQQIAPWLIRQPDSAGPRLLSDRDLIGVLWAALQDARSRITKLENKVKA